MLSPLEIVGSGACVSGGKTAGWIDGIRRRSRWTSTLSFNNFIEFMWHFIVEKKLLLHINVYIL
jgi:hypothetical protein